MKRNSVMLKRSTALAVFAALSGFALQRAGAVAQGYGHEAVFCWSERGWTSRCVHPNR